MMFRRAFVLALSFCSLLAVCAAQASDLRISHQWAAGKDARDAAARIFADEVTTRSPATRLSIVSNTSLGLSPVEQFDAMKEGRIELTIFPLFYISPRFPELSITLLPGLPAAAGQAQLLKGSEFHTRLQEFCEQHGFRILTWWWLEGGIVSVEPIDGPMSVRGMRIRSGDPIFDRMFESLGAETQLMDSPRIAGALQDRTLHAALASLESLVSLGIVKQSRHAIVGGNALYVSLHPLMISKKVWDGLSALDRQAMEQAAHIADTAFLKSQIDVEKAAIAALQQAGSTVRTMPFEEYQAWLEVANATAWSAYREVSPTASQLLTLMLRGFIESKGPK